MTDLAARNRQGATRNPLILRTVSLTAACFIATLATDAHAKDDAMSDHLDRLIAAYPSQNLERDGASLVWPDGTRMPFDDGRGKKSYIDWLAAPDLQDTMDIPYRAFTAAVPPAANHDPGRARNRAFFEKMYGRCHAGDVKRNLKTITWLPKKKAQRLRVSTINGVAEKLSQVSRELDELPARFDKYLAPAAGTYNCRTIAGTNRASAHSYGIAIDIAIKHTNYWRWSRPDKNGNYPYKNKIPQEIVDIFEKHGFIWGGRWYHYDTMHFEYRPELFPREPPPATNAGP